MRILDRYLVRSFVLPLFYCLLTFIFLYIIIDLLGHLDEILKKGVPFSILLDYYLCFVPIILVQTIPVATLLATVYCLGSMNRHNEITTMRTSGLSLWSIIRPLIFMGVLISLVVLIVNEKIVPDSSMTATVIKEEKIERQTQGPKKGRAIKDVAIYGSENRIFYVKEFDISNSILHHIVILEHDQFQNPTFKITAEEASWIGNRWKFRNCLVYNLDKRGVSLGKAEVFAEKRMDIPETPRDFLRGRIQAQHLGYEELAEYIEKFADADPATSRKLKVDLYSKRSFPFISLVIVLIGSAFGLKAPSKGGILAGLGLSLGLGFSYYTVMAVGLALGKGGWLYPFVSAWLANVGFGLMGIALLWKLAR